MLQVRELNSCSFWAIYEKAEERRGGEGVLDLIK